MLREARPGDFDTLLRIDHICFVSGISYSRKELLHYMTQAGAFTLVAESGGVIAAFLVAECSLSRTLGKRIGHIITIDVLPEQRRAGWGTQLMDACEQRMREQLCDLVRLEVAVDNQPAIAFYRRRGYTTLKTIPRYYLDRIDALVMGKVLGK